MQIETHYFVLEDMDAWNVFVSYNREAIEYEYGSVERAYQHAVQGELMLGGGASPVFHVSFAE